MNISFLVHLVDSYGYLLVGGVIFLESMGLFLPGETVLLLASAYAAQGRLINRMGDPGSRARGGAGR
jgi:membrane protein DedA with SNARE-associated domain